MCCCSGPILSFLIWCFLDPQSFSNLSFNCHTKHNAAVLLLGIVPKHYFWSPVRGTDLPLSCFESRGSHQRPGWAVSLEILFHPWGLCPKLGNFPEVKRAAPFTDGATGPHIKVHTAQLHSNANNRCFIAVRGFTNHAFSILNCCDKLFPGKLSIKAQFYPSPVQNQLFYKLH